MTGEAQSSPAYHRLPAAIAALLLLVAPTLRAQQRGARSTPASPAPQQAPAAAPAAGSGAAERVETSGRVDLRLGPDSGATIGSLNDSATARVTARRGDWVRVQVDGWVRADEVRALSGPLRGVTAAELRASPERYVGQQVEWKLQLIGVQVADELRPEMPAGQAYLLTRGPLPEPGFVYVMVPRGEVARFKALPPLTELTARLVIVTSRTRFLATPVAELVGIVDSAR